MEPFAIDDGTLRDHCHSVGERLGLVHVVRGQKDRLAQPAQALDQRLARVSDDHGFPAAGRDVT